MRVLYGLVVFVHSIGIYFVYSVEYIDLRPKCCSNAATFHASRNALNDGYHVWFG